MLYFNRFLNPFIFRLLLLPSSTIAFCHFFLRISVILKKGTRLELTCFWPYPFIHLKITVANYEKCARVEKWQSSLDRRAAYPLTGICLFCYSWQLGLYSSKEDADSIFFILPTLKIMCCFCTGKVLDEKYFPICTANKKHNPLYIVLTPFWQSKPHEERSADYYVYIICTMHRCVYKEAVHLISSSIP